MKTLYLTSLVALTLATSCAKHSGDQTTQSLRAARQLPALGVVQDAELTVTDNDNTLGLFLTPADQQRASPVLRASYAAIEDDHHATTGYTPVISESISSSGTGGLLKLGQWTNLQDYDLTGVQAMIQKNGLRHAYDIAYNDKAASDFTNGSVWVVSEQDVEYAGGPMWQYTVLVKLEDGFTPDSDAYKVRGRKVRILYEVLEYRQL